MRTRDERKPVVVVESLADVLTECVSSSSGAYSPSAAVVGVGPKQIAHRTLVRHLLYPVQCTDVIKRVNAGRETSVKTEDLVVDERGKRQEVEQVCEVLPDVGVAVFAQALVVEAIHLGDLAGLVVATQDGDAAWVADLEGDEQSDGLDREVATVDVVTHEEVVGVGIRASNLEQLHQVVELTVDVTAHCHRALHGLHIALVLQDFPRLLAQPPHFILGQLLACHQALDPAVKGADVGWVHGVAQSVLDLSYVLHVGVSDRLPQRGSLRHFVGSSVWWCEGGSRGIGGGRSDGAGGGGGGGGSVRLCFAAG